MVNLDIGCDFSVEHVETIIALNKLENAKHRIDSVYGSPGAANPFGSVRPLRREHTEENFFKHVYLLNEAGIRANITLNSLVPCRSRKVECNIFDNTMTAGLLQVYLKGMEGYNVALIVSHPGLLDWLHAWKGWAYPLPITISTIMNVHRLSQMEYIKQRWPLVTKICPALWKNRDFPWLKAANKIILLELLANEFCSIGGIECEGLYRQTCYMAQSLGIKNWNPMDVCIAERKKHPEAWLMARFILPQWLDKYKKKTGVEHFKITGRTHPASFIKDVGTKYVMGMAEGNLLSLWGQLEATMEGSDQAQEQVDVLSENYIPIKIAEKLIHHIHSCSVGERCGTSSCKVCKFYLKQLKG